MHADTAEFRARMKAEVHDVAALLDDDPAVALEHITQAYALLGTAEHMAVRNMRAAGATWQQVADALGISRQGAWRRFAPLDEVGQLSGPPDEPPPSEG